MYPEFIEKTYRESKIFPTPEIRNLFLKIAEYFYSNGQYQESIFFHLKSHCLSFDTKNLFHNPKLDTAHIPSITTWSDIIHSVGLNYQNTDTASDPLVDFAMKEIQFEDELNDMKKDSLLEKKLNISEEIIKIKKSLKILPKEWTVLQITKNYDPTLTISIHENFLPSAQPIYIIILKHLRSHQYPDLISLKIPLSKDLFEKFYDIRNKYKITFSFWIDDEADRKNPEKQKLFYENLSNFENEITNAIGLFIEELGPWVKLFSCSDIESEKTLKNLFKVDNFCDKYKLENNVRVLLSLLVIDGQHFFTNDIEKLMPFLNPTNSAELEKRISEFLKNEKFEYNKKSENPCLLILDEMLDHFPWEMIKPDQEFYRLSSLKIMNQLYEKFKSKIVNGYIQLSIKNGNGLINPEKNLDVMEKRMLEIIQYYFPKWNTINSRIPNSDELINLISTEDIFFYCGHGNCLRFLKSNKYVKTLSKSVIFLFGCESIKLKSSSGLHSELTGAHLYLHSGLCPAIIGCNHVSFDFQLDLMSMQLFTKWIKYDCKKNPFKNLDQHLWKKGNLKFLNDTNNYDIHEKEPKLGKILSDLRCHSDSITNSLTLIYRGLPVLNTNI